MPFHLVFFIVSVAGQLSNFACSKTQCYYNDLPSSFSIEASAAACAEKCRGLSGCRAFTFDSPRGGCHPKHADAQCLINGGHRAQLPDSAQYCTSVPGMACSSTECSGNDLAGAFSKEVSAAACAAKCSSLPGCQAFTYYALDGGCFPKNDDARCLANGGHRNALLSGGSGGGVGSYCIASPTTDVGGRCAPGTYTVAGLFSEYSPKGAAMPVGWAGFTSTEMRAGTMLHDPPTVEAVAAAAQKGAAAALALYIQDWGYDRERGWYFLNGALVYGRYVGDGWWSVASLSAPTCAGCAAGTHSGSGAASCTACPAGTYSPVGATSCSPCAAGSYSSSGAASCTACRAGTYSPAGASACSLCASGLYSPNGATSCAQCPAGTFSSTFGAAACNLCAAGLVSVPGSTACSDQISAATATSAAGAGQSTLLSQILGPLGAIFGIVSITLACHRCSKDNRTAPLQPGIQVGPGLNTCC